jgi:hypothetical protein
MTPGADLQNLAKHKELVKHSMRIIRYREKAAQMPCQSQFDICPSPRCSVASLSRCARRPSGRVEVRARGTRIHSASVSRFTRTLAPVVIRPSRDARAMALLRCAATPGGWTCCSWLSGEREQAAAVGLQPLRARGHALTCAERLRRLSLDSGPFVRPVRL